MHPGMSIETVPNRTSPPAVLRESYRDEQGRAQKRILANLPGRVFDGLKALLTEAW